MKFSEKMWLMILLKVTKKQGFALSLENIFLEKPQVVLPLRQKLDTKFNKASW